MFNRELFSFQQVFLSRLGGKKVDRAVRRILEQIFTNSLAAKYNWSGRKQKVPLNGLLVIAAIKGLFSLLAISHKNIIDCI